MDAQDAYQELGLDPSASDAQLKATWRKLVAAWHPDRNPASDAGRRMQQINKAYQHIRQLRDGPIEGAEGEGDTAPSGTTEQEASSSKAAAKTHVRKVHLTLEDAIHGCTRTLRGHFTQTCDACAGQGQRVLAQACATCKGSGALRKASLFGWLWNEEACTACNGDGRLRAACEVCEGQGKHTVAYQRKVRFPAGVRAGHLLTVPASQHGSVEINLELHLEIEPHPLFGLDEEGVLRCEMPVNGYAWMAGRWVDVPTPEGVQQMRLNRDALVYRLRGQGFPTALRGPRGDYFVKVVPVFPSELDPEQEALLEKLIKLSTRAAAADKSQPLGVWQRTMQRWSGSNK